jgi:hypothetical protein
MLPIHQILNPIEPQPQINYNHAYLQNLGMPNREDPEGRAFRTFIARQKEGSEEESARFERVWNAQEQRWDHKTHENFVLDSILNLQVGYRTSFSIAGYSLGYLCRALVQRHGGAGILTGLFFTGHTHDFKTNVVYGEPVHMYDALRDEERWVTRKWVNRSVDSVHIHYFPLSKINWLDPAEGVEVDTWAQYFDEVSQQEGGSDMNGYTCLEGSFICRMAPLQRNVKRKIFNSRTAGLSNIITIPTVRTFTVPYSHQGVYDDRPPRQFTLFIPSGDGNCVEQAFTFLFRLHFHDNTLRERTKAEQRSWPQWEAWCKELFRGLTEGGKKRKVNKMKKMGFTTRDLRSIMHHLASVGVVGHLYYEFDTDRWGDRMGPSGSGRVEGRRGPNGANLDYTGHFCMLQMNEMGYIYSNMLHCYLSKDANDDATASNLLHAIGVYPHPTVEDFHSSHFRDAFRRAIEAITTTRMKEFFQDMEGETLSQRDDYIEKLVTYQLHRYEKQLTHTLIFKEKKHDQKKWTKKKKTPRGEGGEEDPPPETIIYAYDLETVTNTNECQPKVWAPFRKVVLPNAEPLESQIAFSAQWCAVNVSDTGSFAERKEKENIPLNEYQSDIAPEEHVPGLKPNDPPIRVADYLLSEPKTEYGDFQLGKCVEDMLRAMAVDVVARGGKSGIAYAHNGAGFDAYVVMQFCRFKVERILKTRRGVMSVVFSVPVDEEENLCIPIALRDTKLHVAGSLAALCKGFGVPPIWCKLDFPIDKVNHRNCYHPEILRICEPYGINDIKALAFIIVKINQLIGNSRWEPCDIHNLRPPIAQFLTCMSMVRASTRNHFMQTAKIRVEQLPRAIDIPALRIWLEKATIGGRVNAYAKTYLSAFFSRIRDAYMEDNVDELKRLHQLMLTDKACMVVEDETSLYPATLAKCPMPTGRLYFIPARQAESYIQSMHCVDCDIGFQLCQRHDVQKNFLADRRPFAIIRVKDLTWSSQARKTALRVLCARRLNSAAPTAGLEYTLETNEEMKARYGRGKDVLSEVQSFTNIDLYWMRRSGMTFTIVDGFAFETSFIYSSFIGPAFEERIKAKQAGNKLLSDFLKLNYNGSFGVTAQQNIDSSTSLVTLPEELRTLHPSDSEVIKHIMHQHSVEFGPDEEVGEESYVLPSGQTLLTKKKKAHVAEYYMEQSPVQIGCAILAYARHIVNLVMCNLPEDSQTYTDTDSIAMDEEQRCKLEAAGLINNTDAAPLGTLKNDHQDGNGQEPRVIASLIGTKKVKMHITLNEKGEIRVFNTFKGLNPSDKNEEGKRMTGNWVEYRIASALHQISKDGECSPMKVSQWRKSVGFGVKIGEHQQEMKSETYLAHSKGICPLHKTGGYYEFFVPHGSIMELPYYPILRHEYESKGYYYLPQEAQQEREQNFLRYGWDWNQMDLFFRKFYDIPFPPSMGDCEDPPIPDYDTVHRMESLEYDSILKVFENVQ